MKKIGFIGFGHMGEVLLRAILKNSLVTESVIVSSRTITKLNELGKEFPEVSIVDKSPEVAKNADLLFICVNTYEVINVISEISQYIKTDTHVITISGGLTIASIENKINGKISKVIPSLTCEAGEGTSLVCHNKYVNENDRDYLENVFRKIGNVMVIKEEQFPIYTALSSCAPGLIASIFELLLESALKYEEIDEKKAFQILLHSIEGTSKLIREKDESFSNLIKRVARKGGNTEIGVNLFRRNFPEVFDDMFSEMFLNEKNRNLKTAEQFKV